MNILTVSFIISPRASTSCSLTSRCAWRARCVSQLKEEEEEEERTAAVLLGFTLEVSCSFVSIHGRTSQLEDQTSRFCCYLRCGCNAGFSAEHHGARRHGPDRTCRGAWTTKTDRSTAPCGSKTEPGCEQGTSKRCICFKACVAQKRLLQKEKRCRARNLASELRCAGRYPPMCAACFNYSNTSMCVLLSLQHPVGDIVRV